MPRKTGSLMRSHSYFNVLKPYLTERCANTYATCPPINLHQKQRIFQNSKSSNSTRNLSLSVQASKTSFVTASHSSILHYDWKITSKNDSLSKKEKHHFKREETKLLNLFENVPCYNTTIMQRSLPVFDVLPALDSDHNEQIRYEKIYLLDSSSFDYKHAKTKAEYGKIKFDYLSLFQIINKRQTPSDCDIIFGDAKYYIPSKCGWERSRIDWLFDLECPEAKNEIGNQTLLEDGIKDDLLNSICGCSSNLGSLKKDSDA